MPKNGPKSPLTGPYHCLFIFFPKYYGSSEYSTSLATPPDPIKYFWRIIEAPICPKICPKKQKSTANWLKWGNKNNSSILKPQKWHFFNENIIVC